ncbi:MAG: DNA-binding Lrp family transcriptional regulator [Verrucomicrobiales bacterium]|jgi:DNA-binding Lrp family transcriptional regulator
MSQLLELLQKNARQTNAELAELLGRDEAAVTAELTELEKDGTIMGYTAILDPERHEPNKATAMIEIRLSPERGGGFDRLAHRVAAFPEVKSCFLMSGTYDLLAIVEGEDLREVARFVSETLSTMSGILSTATHFQLKTYKANGLLQSSEREMDRLPVSP